MIEITLVIVAALLVCYEQYARSKRKKIKIYQEVVYTDLKSKKLDLIASKANAIDSIALGIGASSLNIMDIYFAAGEHSKVLETLQYRFPRELSSFDSSTDWFNKVENLKDLSPSGSYASAYKGQMAENITMDYMRDHGFNNVDAFESRTHANNDVFGEYNGEMVEVSVKNGSADYIRSMIEQHPDSEFYSINSEAYEEMLSNGEIDSYAKEGIKIFSPGFSEEILAQEGSTALTDIHEAGDLTDDIPYLALAIFGVKVIGNIRQFSKGKQSKYELGMNITVDAGRAVLGGIFAVGGSKVGAAVGTFVAPGIGTLIGGGIGAIAGAFTGGSVFNKVKEQVKWGYIIRAFDYFGEKYKKGFSSTMRNNMISKYANVKQFDREIEEEDQLRKQYNKALNPYSFRKTTINSVIVAEHYENLKLAQDKFTKALSNTSSELWSFCLKISHQVFPNKSKKEAKFANRLYGNLIITNDWLMKDESFSNEEIELIRKYHNQLEISPNHPYKLEVSSTELLDGMFYQSYDKAGLKIKTYIKNYSIVIYSVVALLLFLAIYLEFFD